MMTFLPFHRVLTHKSHLNHILMNFRCKDINFPRNFQIKPHKPVKDKALFKSILTV